jgi:hypothetical protein
MKTSPPHLDGLAEGKKSSISVRWEVTRLLKRAPRCCLCGEHIAHARLS